MEDNTQQQPELFQPKFGGEDNNFSVYEKSKVTILPVPYGKTVTYRRGAEKGPFHILDASGNVELFDDEIGKDTYRIGIHTADTMIVDNLPPEEMVSTVEKRVASLVRDAKFPVMIGGEHTATIGAVKALAKDHKDLSVFYMDAHHDLRDSYNNSKFNHACVARRLSEFCRVVIVGARNLSKEGKSYLPNPNVTVFNVYDILDIPNWKEKIKDALTDNVYISIDLDVFDPSVMPAVGAPEPGGMGWYEVLDLVRFVMQYKNIVGMDVMELAPVKDMVTSDFMAAKLIYKLLGYNFLVNDKRLPKPQVNKNGPEKAG